MKKSFYVVLILSLYLSYTPPPSSFVNASTSPRLPRRLSTEELRVGASETAQERTSEQLDWEAKGGFEGEGLIYNADYRGVSTHTAPVLPKHPEP